MASKKMTLDITQVYGQIEAMAVEMRSRRADYGRRLELAMSVLKTIPADQTELQKRIEAATGIGLVAELREHIAEHKSPVPCPSDFITVASDGSHIDVDRHYSPRLFLLNIGLVYLRYGDQPDADFATIPTIYFGDEMQSIKSDDGKKELIEGPLLGIKRGVEECRHLADRICSIDNELPVLGLIDGSLIMWGLVANKYQDFVVEELLRFGYLKQLDRIYDLSRKKRVALASFISFPRSTDVADVLRLQLCTKPNVSCHDENCNNKTEGRECDVISGVLDRDIFGKMLTTGERSATFVSRSSINKSYYGIHETCFFYLKLDEEVARVEIPLWVAESTDLLDMVHSVIVDQCNKGFGYPVALSEAHEQAVVTGTDREQFWDLVDRVLHDDNMAPQRSLKQRSKKVRWI